MKNLIKKFIPKFALQSYHWLLARLAVMIYRNPSKKMTVIGVTGTNGKSSTVKMIASVLEESGNKVGYTSTVAFQIAGKEFLNKTKMTMLGRFALQKLLRKMLKAGCKYAVLEVSSQGIEQYRHLGIDFNYAVFTNLTPEHIEAHGSFEKYRAEKEKLFASGAKTFVLNMDDENVEHFSKYDADKKLEFSLKNVQNLQTSMQGTSFEYKNQQINLKLLGDFNVYNALPAILIAEQEAIDLKIIKRGLEKVQTIPGRMEFLDEGQNFNVLVDYAPEPASLRNLYVTLTVILSPSLSRAKNRHDSKVIHVLGSCGGGRDTARRPVLGKIAGENADVVIVTNEDPYDDDPMQIIEQVAQGAIDAGKREGENLFKILDRKQAIEKAVELARKGDLVLITGKGAEQAMVVKNNQKIPWDDRDIARKAILAK